MAGEWTGRFIALQARGCSMRAEQFPEVRPGVRCPTGESRITPGFDLPARHVIHTVGPVWRGGGHGEPELLSRCYRGALTLAAQHRLRTIAFPAISCGVYGFPLDAAAAIAIHEVRSFGSDDNPWPVGPGVITGAQNRRVS